MELQGEEFGTAALAEGSHWWALYTRHQHEKQVAGALQRKGIEVFLPLYDSFRRWKDRRKVLALPLFPCYVFVRGLRECRLGILSTPGVHAILTRGEKAAEIPEEEIQAIRRSLDARYAVEPHPYLSCGDRVRVTRGALEGIEGVLVRKKNLFRLVLSVEMLAQSVAVEIDGTDVQPVRPSTLQLAERRASAWRSYRMTTSSGRCNVLEPRSGLAEQEAIVGSGRGGFA